MRFVPLHILILSLGLACGGNKTADQSGEMPIDDVTSDEDASDPDPGVDAGADAGGTDDEADAFEGDEPGECTDGADNDRDGLFDCDDPGCEGAPDCTTDSDADENQYRQVFA